MGSKRTFMVPKPVSQTELDNPLLVWQAAYVIGNLSILVLCV